MSPMKRDDFFFPTVGRFFDDFIMKDLLDMGKEHRLAGTTVPAVNIKETEGGFHVEVAAPGLNKEDFSVELDKNLLTISAEKKVENEKEEKGRYTRREYSYTSFSRSFNLPENLLDEEKIVAKYNDGVLHLHLPKKDEAAIETKKTIKIG